MVVIGKVDSVKSGFNVRVIRLEIVMLTVFPIFEMFSLALR